MTSSQDSQQRPGQARGPRVPSGGPTIRLRDPAGVVAAVPYLLGFAPRRSLVVVGVRGDGAVGPTVRCDLDLADLDPVDLDTDLDTDLHPDPDPAPDRAADAGPDPDVGGGTGVAPAARPGLVWAHLQRLLHRNGCRTGVAVVYADVDPLELPPGRLDALGSLLRADPEDAEGLSLLDVVLVGPGRFRSLQCLDGGCCPVEGNPLGEAAGHAVAASFVLAGRSPAPDREGVQPPDRSTTRTERSTARAAARRAASRRRAAGPTANGREDLRLFEQWCRALERRPGVGPDPELAGRLVAGWCRSSRLRDACLTVFLPGGACAGLDVLVGTAACGDAFGRLVEQQDCADVERDAAPVLRRLAGLAVGRDRAAVLASHAWLCWVSGDGTGAMVLVERAHLDDPGQRLAALVGQCLEHGVGAPWTTAEPPS